MLPEKTYYSDPDIRVTGARIIVRGKSVSLDDVVSVVQIVEEPRLIGFPVLILVVAVVGSAIELHRFNAAEAFLFAMVALFSILAMLARQDFYTISVVKGVRAVPVLFSHDPALAVCTCQAIEAAIAHRGSAAVR